MKTRQPTLLLHPLFLSCLALLLLNDFYLKYEFHNWFTGKLSDFTGLFAFAIFIVAFLPKHRFPVLIFCGLFFIWWKSPLSNAAITFLNHSLHFSFQRVVDYSDYWALSILPFAYTLKPMSYSRSLVLKMAIWCIGIISFFAFTATSMIRKLADDNRIKLDKTITTKKSEGEIIDAFQSHGLNPQSDSAIYEKLWSDRYYVKSKGKNGEVTMMPVDSLYAGVYTKIAYGSIYTIPKMDIDGYSIYNLQLIISSINKRKTEVWLHSFEYRAGGTDSVIFSSYPIWRTLKKPIKKEFKKLIR